MTLLRTYCILFLLILCVVLLIMNQTRKKENFNQNTPRILIVIISAHSKNSRWEYEKKTWENYMKSSPNIDCIFTECKEHFTVQENCLESFKPGIFQKTILTLSNTKKEYDYYIRTNLSTFYIFDYLSFFVRKIPTNIPSFGGYCTNWGGIQGTGIVMNRMAKDILVYEGKKFVNFENSYIADDVLISNILKHNNVQQKCLDFMFLWDFTKSNEENVKRIKEKYYPSIRLKTTNSEKYHEITKFLFDTFY